MPGSILSCATTTRMCVKELWCPLGIDWSTRVYDDSTGSVLTHFNQLWNTPSSKCFKGRENGVLWIKWLSLFASFQFNALSHLEAMWKGRKAAHRALTGRVFPLAWWLVIRRKMLSSGGKPRNSSLPLGVQGDGVNPDLKFGVWHKSEASLASSRIGHGFDRRNVLFLVSRYHHYYHFY